MSRSRSYDGARLFRDKQFSRKNLLAILQAFVNTGNGSGWINAKKIILCMTMWMDRFATSMHVNLQT